MKKVLAIVALVAAMFFAQNAQAQSTIYATYAPETFVTNNSNSNYQGFSVGFSQNVGLYKGLGLAAGAQFRMNTKSETALGITAKDKQYLIDVPVLLNYGISVTRDLTIAPFVGPMFSLALAGNTKVGNLDPVNWYGDNSSLNRFNLYAVLGVDVKFSQFNLFGGYRWGMLDLNKNNNITTKANGFFVGLGFDF